MLNNKPPNREYETCILPVNAEKQQKNTNKKKVDKQQTIVDK